MSKGQLPTNNTEDQCDGDALVPAYGGRDNEGCGRSLAGSEKDSGYSDNGSDRQQMEAVPGQAPGTTGHGEAPWRGHVQLPSQGRPRLVQHRAQTQALTVPGSGEVSPVYILQSLMLHQERSAVPGVLDKADLNQHLWWTNNRGVSDGPRPGQVLLLHQAGVVPAPKPRYKHQTRVVPGTGRRKPSSFLRIAPHPSKTPLEKRSPIQGLPHLRKRVLCPEVQREEPVSEPRGSRPPPASSLLSSEWPASPSSSSSPAASRATEGPPGRAAHYRRFLGTMKALKQSGLLDITLRTQELMRRSAATDRDIGQLGRHARLLCRLSGRQVSPEQPNGPPPWEKLHRAMARSGGYPGLRMLHREPCSPEPGGSLAVSPLSSSSPSPSPGPNRNTAASRPSGKVTAMTPPDSSTG
ncbi:hypothetical protein NHX12_009309 [Muraenolepis orangiensis]|uniref:CLOCK-interacting pacemaker-like n=1 Tax=Muraenolepis orangiensis TaxID=630683 RepID=A0A9Q0DL91_9TELE|nr:hypothetical protein NHX12_009309 [Muraenolepis orangiensis]